MKKFIISLIAGAVLIGIGIGVMMLEIAQYDTSETFPFISDSPVQTFTFNDSEAFDEAGDNDVNIYAWLGSYFDENGKIEVVEDKNAEGMEITIHYRGQKPEFYFSSHHYDHRGHEYEYSLNAYSREVMPKDILKAAEYMCKNKTIVMHQEMFYVEKVTIKTDSPERIIVDD